MTELRRFSNLPEYAFPRLRNLLKNTSPGSTPIDMHIGAPRHPYPGFILKQIIKNAESFSLYPPNEGTSELRLSISNWIKQRYDIDSVDPDKNIMVLNGSREGLFNSTLALSPIRKNKVKPFILMPNPFYQCYMVAAEASGAIPIFLPTESENDFLPNIDNLTKTILENTTIIFLCSPSNPQGAIISQNYWEKVLRLAEKYDFLIFSDECYSEIYYGIKPPGILQAAANLGTDPNRVVVFNSLSKRSNLAGLRSGFVASGELNIAELKKLKAYTGAPSPIPLQLAAAAAWAEETHVIENRKLYKKKLAISKGILEELPAFFTPSAGFFLWLEVNNDEVTALNLWEKYGVKVLPGSYLSNSSTDAYKKNNPNYIRIALVGSESEVEAGCTSIFNYLTKN